VRISDARTNGAGLPLDRLACHPRRGECGSRAKDAALRLSIGSSAGPCSCEDRRVAGRFGFNPKKSGPDHAVPVIFRNTE
jgi:hypothetical protein